MYNLDGNALTSIFEKCGDNANYKVGIMIDNRERQSEFMSTMKEAENRHHWSINVRNGTIKFKNGSVITAIPTLRGKCCRAGQRFHEILFDGEFNEELLNSVYEPMLVEYEPPKFERCDEKDKSLDDFLGEFKVIA